MFLSPSRSRPFFLLSIAYGAIMRNGDHRGSDNAALPFASTSRAYNMSLWESIREWTKVSVLPIGKTALSATNVVL